MAVIDLWNPDFDAGPQPALEEKLTRDRRELQDRIRLGVPIGDAILESIRKGEPVEHWPVYEFTDTRWAERRRAHLRLVDEPAIDGVVTPEISQPEPMTGPAPSITAAELLSQANEASRTRDKAIFTGLLNGVAVVAMNNWVEPGPKRF